MGASAHFRSQSLRHSLQYPSCRPLLTWNNCVGGFFMVVFGIAVAVLGISGFSAAASEGSDVGGKQSEGIREQALFLDVYAGRGIFLIYLAIRLMTLGKYYCLMAGLGLFFFGICNLIVHGFVVAGQKNAASTSTTSLLSLASS